MHIEKRVSSLTFAPQVFSDRSGTSMPPSAVFGQHRLRQCQRWRRGASGRAKVYACFAGYDLRILPRWLRPPLSADTRNGTRRSRRSAGSACRVETGVRHAIRLKWSCATQSGSYQTRAGKHESSPRWMRIRSDWPLTAHDHRFQYPALPTPFANDANMTLAFLQPWQ